MSFLENFQKSYKEENKKIQDRMNRSNYKTQQQLKYEQFALLSNKGDGELIKKFRNLPDSSEDKNIIKNILIQRGYTNVNGNFRRI
jgi:hypothetical protein